MVGTGFLPQEADLGSLTMTWTFLEDQRQIYTVGGSTINLQNWKCMFRSWKRSGSEGPTLGNRVHSWMVNPKSSKKGSRSVKIEV